MGVEAMSGRVVVIGWGASGRGAARALLARGREVLVFDQNPPKHSFEGLESIEVTVVEDARELAQEAILVGPEVIVVSPGIPAHAPIFAAAKAVGIPVWGEVELAWRLQEEGTHAGRPWLVVTGTNGKTTTLGMLGSILRANGENAMEVGNVGTPITEAIDSDAEVFAVEISSFQLHTTLSVSPEASVCLNVDADHVDWHGSVEAYAADKARVYERTRIACVYPASDRVVEAMVENADVVEGARAIGVTLGTPYLSQVGIVEGSIVDRAFLEERKTHAIHLADLADLEGAYGPHPGAAVINDALAAAALARAHGVSPEAVSAGLREYRPLAHRRAIVAQAAELTWIDDSKATNAHAARACLAGIPAGRAVWIVGGDTKGQDLTGLVAEVAPLLRGAIVIGEEREPLLRAFAQGAPAVPLVEVDGHEDWMFSVVNEAVALSLPGDTVVFAPACASWDQFENYVQRGEIFVEAVKRLAAQWGSTDGSSA